MKNLNLIKNKNHLKTKRLLLFLFIVLLLMGCDDEHELDDPLDLNRSLFYIRPEAPKPSPTQCCKYQQTNRSADLPIERPKFIQIVNGMKLVFHSSPLRGKQQNDQQPIITKYEWIMPKIPENPMPCDFANENPLYSKRYTYSREDYFFLKYLLTVGTPFRCNSSTTDRNRCFASEKLNELGKNLSNSNSNEFNRRYNECFLIPTLNTLRVYTDKLGNYTPVVIEGNRSYEVKNRSAYELRELFSQPMRQEFDNYIRGDSTFNFNSHWLQAYFLPNTPHQIKLKMYDWGWQYFNDDVQERSKSELGLKNNPWFNPNRSISSSRGFVEVQVPVRVSSETHSLYYPVYFSYRDLEEKLGKEIIGFRRNKKFLGVFRFRKKKKVLYFDPSCDECKKLRDKFVSSGDDYFTVKFGKKGKSFNSDAVVSLRKNRDAKREILIAPGDVVITSKKRVSATDSPEVR